MRAFIRLIRFFDWFYLTGIAILGLAYGTEAGFPAPGTAVFTVIISSLYLAYGYTINDYFDIYIIQQQRKEDGKKLLFWALAFMLINIIVSLLYARGILTIVLAGGLLGYIYVAPPIRLKKNLLLNFLLNSAGFSLVFLIGFIASNAPRKSGAVMITIFFALIFISLQIIHHISHCEEDRLQKTTNIMFVLDNKKISWLFFISLFIAGICSFFISLTGWKRVFFILLTLTFFSAVFIYYKLRTGKTGLTYGEGISIRTYTRKLGMLYGILTGIIFLMD